MRFLILTVVLLLTVLRLPAQNYEPTHPHTAKDTIAPPPDTSIGTILRVDDSLRIRENIISGLDSYMKMQEEQNQKRKRAAMVRIGIGAGLLAILIIGLLRKKNK